MLGGALAEFGGNDKFVKDLAEAIPAGGAAIIVLARKVKADDLFAGLSAADGTVFHTAFDKSAVEAVREALATRPNARPG